MPQVSTHESVSDDKFDMAVRAFLSNLIGGDYAHFESMADMSKLKAQARYFFLQYDNSIMWTRDLSHTHRNSVPVRAAIHS